MIAMATIIDRLTARAATEMDRRGTAADRLVTASQSSTRSSRRAGRTMPPTTPVRIVGTSNDMPKTIAIADA